MRFLLLWEAAIFKSAVLAKYCFFFETHSALLRWFSDMLNHRKLILFLRWMDRTESAFDCFKYWRFIKYLLLGHFWHLLSSTLCKIKFLKFWYIFNVVILNDRAKSMICVLAEFWQVLLRRRLASPGCFQNYSIHL